MNMTYLCSRIRAAARSLASLILWVCMWPWKTKTRNQNQSLHAVLWMFLRSFPGLDMSTATTVRVKYRTFAGNLHILVKYKGQLTRHAVICICVLLFQFDDSYKLNITWLNCRVFCCCCCCIHTNCLQVLNRAVITFNCCWFQTLYKYARNNSSRLP